MNELTEYVSEKNYSAIFKNGEDTGEIELRHLDDNVYSLRKFQADSSGILVQKLIDFAKKNDVEIMTDDRPVNEHRATFLKENGFTLAFSKLLFEKDLNDELPQPKFDFELRSIAETGEESFLKIFKKVSDGDVEQQGDHAEFFHRMREMASDAYAPEEWFTVFFKGEEIGIIMPQIYHDEPGLGSIFYIGVVPEQRGKGFGKELHALCLTILAKRGASRYVGSTSVDNTAMISVFKNNQCNLLFKRFFFKAL